MRHLVIIKLIMISLSSGHNTKVAKEGFHGSDSENLAVEALKLLKENAHKLFVEMPKRR